MKMNNNRLKTFIKQQTDVLDAMEHVADDAVAVGFDEEECDSMMEYVGGMRSALGTLSKMLQYIDEAKERKEETEAEDDDDLSFLD